jgi:hypothetical protein
MKTNTISVISIRIRSVFIPTAKRLSHWVSVYVAARLINGCVRRHPFLAVIFACHDWIYKHVQPIGGFGSDVLDTLISAAF